MITFIAAIISSTAFVIVILISGIIFVTIYPYISVDNIIILILAIIIETVFLFLLFRTRRLKNGLAFLKNKHKINNIGVVGNALIVTGMLIYSIVGTYSNRVLNTYLFMGLVIELICLIVWIRRKITKFYKQKLKEQTVEELSNEIKEKDELINKITEENKALATINHKYSSRIKALENFTSKIALKPELTKKFETELGVEFANIKEQISKLSKEYSEEVDKTIKHDNILPKTGIFGIDNLLEYMNSEAIKNNIKFDLKVNGNLNEIIEKVIPQNKLETLLGDHIKDAMIAINSSETTNKSILLEIGKTKEYYEICIYDTGIEFDIDTLLKLGAEQVTTHKASGGSGIGFMTTFKTLKECNASLVIEEMTSNKYTKAVKVVFDEQNQYRIYSQRAEKIRKQANDDRIVIKEN